jgi:hypothetical protein
VKATSIGGQGDREREAAGELDVDGVEQDDGRDQQLAAGDAHERGDNPNS